MAKGGKKQKVKTDDDLPLDGNLATPAEAPTGATQSAQQELPCSVLDLPIEQIASDAECAAIRLDQDEEADKALVASVKMLGILTPVLVRKLPEKPGDKRTQYAMIGGHRRLRAAAEAGLKTIPARVVDDARIATELGEKSGRKRVDAAMGGHFVGVVDNLARSGMSENDLLRALRWMVNDVDRESRYRRADGRIHVNNLAKDLGVSYQWLRSRALALETFNDEELKAIGQKITEHGEDGVLSWWKVHQALRSGAGEALQQVRDIVWPDERGEAGASDELETPEEGAGAAVKPSSPLEVRSRVRFDALASDGIGVKFVGVPGKRAMQAEITVRVSLKKRSFAGETGDDNFKDMLNAAAEACAGWSKLGTGKDRDRADIRVGALSACDSAVHSLASKISTGGDNGD